MGGILVTTKRRVFNDAIEKEHSNFKGDDPVNERQKLIIQLINKDKNITKDILSAKCKISIETIKRDLRILKQAGLIQRIGSAKGGYWEV